MLQQTRVDTVIPYFHRFVQRFPTVADLAAAPLDDVLAAWSGLGYYRRARNLHAAANAVAQAGSFPRDRAGLQALPGVGRYTAGAIGSIALGLDLPVVDGNVERVFARFYAVERPSPAWCWGTAERLLPSGRAGAFNQGVMELGATVCTPRDPSCASCPLAPACAGRSSPTRYPAPPPRRDPPVHQRVAAALLRGNAVLLVQRPPTGMLAGPWELPSGLGTDVEAVATARVGARVIAERALGVSRHKFSHLTWETTVVSARVEGEPIGRWVNLADAGAVAVSTCVEKMLKLVRGAGAAAA